MPKLNQKGIIHLLLPIILILGLIAGVYLVTSGNPLKLFSRASVSRPVGPETSFSLIGPNQCASGWACTTQFFFPPQPKEEFSVKLYARSDIEEANLFVAKLKFPADLLQVKEIIINNEKKCEPPPPCPAGSQLITGDPGPDGPKCPSYQCFSAQGSSVSYLLGAPSDNGSLQRGDSFVKNWVEDTFDNEAGTISLVGGVPDPGYKTQTGGESALMATIVFKTKTEGQGTVSFTDNSAIYSNLNNINILTIKRGYDISVEVAPSPKPTCLPRPACLDYKGESGPCMIPEPEGGWCPGPLPTSTPSPKPTCLPRPACLDAKPACKIAESVGGWCTEPSPVPGTRGDGNKDNKINLVDMSVIHTDWMKTSGMANFRAGIDMNDDKLINTFDFSLHRKLLQQLGIIRVK